MPTSNEITTVVQGYVGTEIDFVHLGNTPKATFRLGSTSRYFDRAHEAWTDRPTTWLRVECWRSLAQHVAASLHKGEPVLVRGRLRTSEWTDADGARQSRLYLDADLVGHDLTRGTSSFARSESAGPVRGEQQTLGRDAGVTRIGSRDADDQRDADDRDDADMPDDVDFPAGPDVTVNSDGPAREAVATG